MAVKIRLQRHGKKGKPFYWIVAADARSKRDGKYLEKIGTYDPNQKPAAIDLNFDSALSWLDKGAQPTSTAKAILSYTGVLFKKHLDGGVKKGAFTEAEAKKKFDAWMKEKSAKIEKKIEELSKSGSYPKVYLTGGDADFFVRQMDFPALELDMDLVLDGLRIACGALRDSG